MPRLRHRHGREGRRVRGLRPPAAVPNHDRTACMSCLDGHVEAETGECTQCMDGKEPNETGSACEACGPDAVGRNGACMTCGTGKVPNSGHTACQECPDGESTTAGTCNADSECLDVECSGPFKRCVEGECVCEAGFVDDGLAVKPGHMDLRCQDSLLIVGFGVKTVTDYCPICKTGEEPGNHLPQLDNYTTEAACEPGAISDLGVELQTIKLLEPR